MSYLVLARKWRPKRFDELVGQEHVVRALSNALETGRVHHAFLFTGTRGVGKTTIARIFAKSLNCERGAGAEPCGECASCMDIDAGRFVDLLEIDAASNTGVDDVRALIENAQYMPARGRTKVYLIDEVHMLSKQAFNALLKTLEEPPGHVKFLLATTDPQKLPITVLSRCLQFNLRRLEQEQIAGQMRHILQAEGMAFEPAAIALLARSADGSLRDGLSLLDQAIAYTGGKLELAGVNAMLGTVEGARICGLLEALADGNGQGLLEAVAEMARYSPDFGQVLEDAAILLHRIQLRQLIPGLARDDSTQADVEALAPRLSPELVQLWYQMAINGRRDLGLAPSPRAGFEMTLLRMLAFRPGGTDAAATESSTSRQQTSGPAPTRSASASPTVNLPAAVAPAESPTAARSPLPAASTASAPASRSAFPSAFQSAAPKTATLAGVEDWMAFVAASTMKGPTRQLAAHCSFLGADGGIVRLSLASEDEHLRNDTTLRQLTQALASVMGESPQLRFESAGPGGDTLQARTLRDRDARQRDAEARFIADPVVSRLLEQGGVIVPDSIKPTSENHK